MKSDERLMIKDEVESRKHKAESTKRLGVRRRLFDFWLFAGFGDRKTN